MYTGEVQYNALFGIFFIGRVELCMRDMVCLLIGEIIKNHGK